VLQSIFSRFQTAYTPNEQTTTNEQLVALRCKCPFYMMLQNTMVWLLIQVYKIKTGRAWDKSRVAGHAKNFNAYTIQVYTDGGWEKKQGLQVVKDSVCHMSGTRTGITTDNFFTSCELESLFLLGI
jgi:hypothetical protein